EKLSMQSGEHCQSPPIPTRDLHRFGGIRIYRLTLKRNRALRGQEFRGANGTIRANSSVQRRWYSAHVYNRAIKKKADLRCVAVSDVRSGPEANILRCERHVRLTPESGHSAYRFDELPKPDRLFRASAMPVISVALALRRTTASAMHPADPRAAHRRSKTRLAISL